jgi:hypothetical protein
MQFNGLLKRILIKKLLKEIFLFNYFLFAVIIGFLFDLKFIKEFSKNLEIPFE